jgi:hypothetical protein
MREWEYWFESEARRKTVPYLKVSLKAANDKREMALCGDA